MKLLAGQAGDERQALAKTREDESVQWIHGLGRAMRRLREASGFSDEELARKLGDPRDDLKHLDDGFSDRVQVGDIKSFVDACGGFLDIVGYDKDGQIVSARELAPIGESKKILLKGTGHSTAGFPGV